MEGPRINNCEAAPTTTGIIMAGDHPVTPVKSEKKKDKGSLVTSTAEISEAMPLIPDSPISSYGDFFNTPEHGESCGRGREPKDYLNLVHAMFFVQGLGLLLPWCMFTTASGYYHERLSGTAYADSFMSYVTTSMLVCQITVMLLDLFRKHTSSPWARIMGSFFVQFCVFALSCVLVHTSANSISGNAFFALLIGSCAVSGAVTALLQSGLFGLAAEMPAEYMRSFMLGQAMGGLFVALANVATLIGKFAAADSAFAYFAMSCAVLVLTMACFVMLMRHPFVRYHIATHAAVDKLGDRVDFSYSRTFASVYPQMLNVFAAFTVTIAVFPGVASRLLPVSSPTGASHGTPEDTASLWAQTQGRLLGDLFVPVFVFVNYNVSDYVGRMLTGYLPWPGIDRLWILVSLRVLLIPAIAMCNVHPQPAMFPDWLSHSNAAAILLVSVLAGSNGFCGSVAMVYGTHNVSDSRDQECAGVLMSIALCGGLLAGSLLSFCF